MPQFVRCHFLSFRVVGLGCNAPIDQEDFRFSPGARKWEYPYPIGQERFGARHASKGWQNLPLYAMSLLLCHVR
jgi:hypothetical protein